MLHVAFHIDLSLSQTFHQIVYTVSVDLSLKLKVLGHSINNADFPTINNHMSYFHNYESLKLSWKNIENRKK